MDILSQIREEAVRVVDDRDQNFIAPISTVKELPVDRMPPKEISDFTVRGDMELCMVMALRAYLAADDSLVAAGTAFDEETMYLYPTWDWERWP